MRKFAFDTITQFFALLVTVIENVSYILLAIVGHVGYFFLKLADAKRLTVYDSLTQDNQAAIELQQQSMELSLLASASQVRDHAQANDEWTPDHADALNRIGEALVLQAGWQTESVQTYLRELTSSIDGLTYGDD